MNKNFSHENIPRAESLSPYLAHCAEAMFPNCTTHIYTSLGKEERDPEPDLPSQRSREQRKLVGDYTHSNEISAKARNAPVVHQHTHAFKMNRKVVEFQSLCKM